MKPYILFILTLCWFNQLFGQNTTLFPVKQQEKWGAINAQGELVIPAIYDAIGDFNSTGIAVIVKNGKAGLVDTQGAFIMPPKFSEIKVISKYTFGIEQAGVWHIVNRKGKVLLSDYDRVQALTENHLLFWKKGLCGIVNLQGVVLVPPQFSHISIDHVSGHFVVRHKKKYGFYSFDGKSITSTRYREYKILNSDFILVKSKYKWGAINNSGDVLLGEHYSHYQLDEETGFLVLNKHKKCYLYSIHCHAFVTHKYFEHFIPISQQFIVFQQHQKMGVMDSHGNIILPPQSEEIEMFSPKMFRVQKGGKWGLVDIQKKSIAPLIYDYISPIHRTMAIAKKGGKYGIINKNGKLLTNTIYDKVELKDEEIHLFQGKSLQVFAIQKNKLHAQESFKKYTSIAVKKRTSPRKRKRYKLKRHEWFYSAVKKKWGLRNNSTGEVRISPKYDHIRIHKDLNLTAGGIIRTQNEVLGDLPIEYRRLVELVDHHHGWVMSNQAFRSVRFDDFKQGNPYARVILQNGRHALVNKKGKLICKDYIYIGQFHEGVAAVSLGGEICRAAASDDFRICTLPEYLKNEAGFCAVNGPASYVPDLTCRKGNWGYIDTIGRMLVSPQYEAAYSFIRTSGIVKKNKKWGLVDSMEVELLPCNYESIQRVHNGKILILSRPNRKYSIIDTQGNRINDFEYKDVKELGDKKIAFQQEKLWGIMTVRGRIITPPTFVKIRPFQDGKAAVFDGQRWGFISSSGHLLIDYEYVRVGNFKNGRAWVKTRKGIGYINTKNQFVIPPSYRKAHDFEGDVARVVTKGKTYIINTKGEIIQPNGFAALGAWDENGIAIARTRKNGKNQYFLVNKKGEKIGRKSFQKIFPFHEKLAAVMKKGKYGFINTQGKLVIPMQFNKVSRFSEGLASVKYKGKCGYINTKGKYVVRPTFSKCADFENGRAIVHLNARKGGVVNKEGSYVMRPRVNRLVAFSEGKGLVKKHNQYHFVRESGEMYEGEYETANSFENGTAIIEDNNKWGIINHKGIAIVSPKYESIERMKNGKFKVKTHQLHGVARSDGHIILPAQYESVEYLSNGTIRVEHGGQLGYLDLNGNWIWKLQ